MAERDVTKLAQALHDAGAMNLDMKVSDMLKVQGVGDVDPGSTVASTVIAWDGYVLVYGAEMRPQELERFARTQNPGR